MFRPGSISIRIAFIVILFISSMSILAQPGGGGDPGHGEPVPLQGIGLLILAGAFLGIKRLLTNRKKESQ